MSDHNEEDVLDQCLSGSGERGMQTSGVGGFLLSSPAPNASLEMPASGDQQEQQQQQSLTFPTTDDAADPSFDPSRFEARHTPDQRASKRLCCTRVVLHACPFTDSTPDQDELVNEVSSLPPEPTFAVELPGDSERALAAPMPSAVVAEGEPASSWLRLIAITLPSISWSCQGRQRWCTRALWSARC
jgi:hypothetical protein